MNKYEIQQKELTSKWDDEKKKYYAEANQIHSVAMQHCNQFNSYVTIINVERHLMRKEISTLYKFLKTFGDVGIKLTPFDYVAEDWLFTGAYSGKNDNNNNVKKRRANSLDFSAMTFAGASIAGAASAGATAVTSMFGISTMAGYASIAAGAAGMAIPLLVPVALPAYLLTEFKKKSNDKENFKNMQIEYEEDCVRWKKDIEKMKDEVSFFATAVQIADMYRILIATVRDTITEKIIPELNGILAFLYADAIKNCIISNEDPDSARIANIAEYRGTPYEKHYIFVKNVFDYYVLISKFFTEPILSNMLQKHKISEFEYERFKKKLKDIGEQQLKIMDNSILGGELK